MFLGILTRLASFSLKNPKTILIIGAVVVLFSFGVHYKTLKGERDKLRVAEAGYELAIEAFVAREGVLQDALINERNATASNARARDAARRALEQFRADRESDPEATEWAAIPVPAGELARLCAAVPQLKGCEQ